MDESTEIISSSEFTSTSPFEILSPEASQEVPKPKMIKNLKEFWHIGRPKSFSSITDISPSSISLRSSTASSTYESLRNAIVGSDGDLNGQVFLEDNSARSEDGTTPTGQCSSSFNDSTKTFKSCTEKNLSRSLDRKSSSTGIPESPNVHRPLNASSSYGNNGELSSLNNKPIPKSTLKNENQVSDLKSPMNNSTNDLTSNKAASKTNLITDLSNFHRSQGSSNKSYNSENVSSNSKCDYGTESEHDSGHCFSESFENSVEPEFQTGAIRQPPKMPSPETLGGGNPFLMFLCLTLLLQHRDHIMKNRMDYNETAMYFDKMIRKHNVSRVLGHARQMYSNYLKQNVSHA